MPVTCKESVTNKKSRVSILRRGLKYAIENSEDPLDVWDAREHLRKALMELGQDLIVCGEASSFLDAQICFQEALDLVLKQNAVHKDIVEETNDNTESAWLIQRNFFLLKGNAYANIGISLMRLSNLDQKNLSVVKKLRNDASDAFLTAKEEARQMKVQAIADRARGANSVETRIDELDATQLEALVLQNYARLLWHNGCLQESFRNFNEAIMAYKMIENSALAVINEDLEFVDRFEAALLQCHDALISLLEYSESVMTKSQGEILSRSIATDFNLYTITLNYGKIHNAMYVTLESLHEHSATSNYQIGSLQNIESRLATIDLALQELSKVRFDCMKSLPVTHISTFTRNDLGTGMACSSSEGIKKRYIVSEANGRSSSRHSGRVAPDDNLYSIPRLSESIEKADNVIFMKWGDEVFSTAQEACQQSQGNAYPCAPPPFPRIDHTTGQGSCE
jgi:hypothetical protein